jgi:hypothetical protein
MSARWADRARRPMSGCTRSGGSRPARPWSSARPPVAWAASPGRSRACGGVASWGSSARPTRPPS